MHLNWFPGVTVKSSEPRKTFEVWRIFTLLSNFNINTDISLFFFLDLSRGLEAKLLHLSFLSDFSYDLTLTWSYFFYSWSMNTRIVTLHPLMLRVQLEFHHLSPSHQRSGKRNNLSLCEIIKFSSSISFNSTCGKISCCSTRIFSKAKIPISQYTNQRFWKK